MKRIEVVAAIITDGKRILATQRKEGEFAGQWEFPGGKIESGEEPKVALRREIQEELDASITVQEYVTTVGHEYPAFYVVMHCYLCTLDEAYFELKEHSKALWLEKDALYSVNWLPADVPVVKQVETDWDELIRQKPAPVV